MRKLLLALTLLFSVLSLGQIQKIETQIPSLTTKVAPMGVYCASAEFYEDGVEVTFQDAEFTKVTALRRFKLTSDDFNSLGKLLTSNENKVDDFYTLKTLDGKSLTFKFSKMMGIIYPIIILQDGVVTYRFPNLNPKQFKKLFNIKE